jgi:Domain of unknown function (DUF4333)
MKATDKSMPNLKKFTLAILLAMGTTALLSGCGNNSNQFAQVPASSGQQAQQTQPQEPDKNDVPEPNKTPRYHYQRINLTALVQSKLEEEISQKTETPVDSVSCPEIKKIVVGETFSCEVTTKDNKTKDVTVTFTNEEGDVKWELSQENSG